MKVTYVDRLEVSETFADWIADSVLDERQAVFRAEFQVTRQSDIERAQNPPISPRRYPVARLVLTRDAMLELHRQLDVIVRRLEAEGKVGTARPVTTRKQ